MKGYFKINFRLFLILLFAIVVYVWYLYAFQKQDPVSFHVQQNCEKEEIQKGSQKANQYFDQYFDEQVARSPEWQSYLGMRTNQDQWTPMTEAYAEENKIINETALAYLTDSILAQLCLDKQTQISAKLFKGKLQQALKEYEYRHYDYPVHQMRGVHTQLPTLLINNHKISTTKDAQDYIARVEGATVKIKQLIEQLELRKDKGVILPKFLFPKVLETINNIKKIHPIEKHLLYKDFTQKVAPLTDKDSLIAVFTTALQNNWGPAYQSLAEYLEALSKIATEDAGVWKFEGGEAYYRFMLEKQTTTSLSPEEIMVLGEEEVARIHKEMEAIMAQVDYQGDRKAFFDFMRSDPQFYYPNTDEGKNQYMADATAIIDSMRLQLTQLFITQPKAALEVKRVEPFREKSAGKAFYQSPAPDGSRPGIYYANTYDMNQMPNYQMEALAYHEAIPGHHMQLSIAQELDDLPKFRRLDAQYTAYIEGWGLYSEYLPKELGFYSNPYSDFGRLAMELWRACRLVVDVGIHAKKWTRQEAIDYYKNNTPNAEGDCIKMVERHMVMPGQATTYKIGMITLLELREKAKDALGDKFDIKQFHEIVLTNGALPLEVLEDLIDEYIQEQSQE